MFNLVRIPEGITIGNPSGLLACKPIIFIKRILALNVWFGI